MANISSWFNDIAGDVPGCPKLVIEASLRSVIRDFCEKTLLWVKQLTPITIVISQVEYSLVAPVGIAASVVVVQRAELNGVRLTEASMDILDRGVNSWRAETSDYSTEYMVDPEKVLRLRETPTLGIVDGLVVWASLKPTPVTDVIPDFVYNDYYEAIIWGVLADLFGKPNKVWTDLAMGDYYHELYKSKTSLGQKRKTTGAVKMVTYVQRPPFFTM